MLTLPASVRVFLATQPTDMRKGFDGLLGLARELFEEDPLSGHLFLFVNRRRDRLKALFWDRDGLAIFYKRLERGSFELLPPLSHPDGSVQPGRELTSAQLAMLLEGIELRSAQRRTRYRREV